MTQREFEAVSTRIAEKVEEKLRTREVQWRITNSGHWYAVGDRHSCYVSDCPAADPKGQP